MTANGDPRPVPVPALRGQRPYAVPRPRAPISLYLDGNEGATPPPQLLARLAGVDDAGALLRSYPSAHALEAALAARFRVAPEQVLVTAGADDALDRACRAFLCPGRRLLLPVPSFEMLARYARIAGGTVVEVPWDLPADAPGPAPYPVRAVLAAGGAQPGIIALISPNNPTGLCAGPAVLRELCAAAPEALVLADQAYGEFAAPGLDLLEEALLHDNALLVRTFSKAWGLAGLRVGYAIGHPRVLHFLRAAGAPYAVSGPSLLLAQEWLCRGEAAMRAFVARVQEERQALFDLLQGLGARPYPSQANFVFARFRDALEVRDALGQRGISVRAFPGRALLDDALRITVPGQQEAFSRLTAALCELREVIHGP